MFFLMNGAVEAHLQTWWLGAVLRPPIPRFAFTVSS